MDEIETVLAHELGHHIHKDLPMMIIFGTLSVTLGLFVASSALQRTIDCFGLLSTSDVAAFPAQTLMLGLYGMITMPVENAFSRWRENLADDYALASTKKADACASAFTRLANQNLGEVDPQK